MGSAEGQGNNKPPFPTRRISTKELDEIRARGLCFRCDDKWTKDHKCREKKLFILEDSYEDDEEDEPEEEPPTEKEEEEDTTTISLHALAGIAAPQTLKIVGYIKKQKVVILVDSGSTHNFINKKVAEQLNCFPYPVKNFQVMISNGGSINCGGKCHNIKVNIGDYNLTTTMYAIPIGGVDVVVGVQWLETLGNITMNLKQHFMRFKLDGIQYQLDGFVPPPSQVISSHRMEKLIWKGAPGIIARCYSLEGSEEIKIVIPELQEVLAHHSKVFEELPKLLPPEREQDHAIELLAGSNPQNVIPYRYPYQQKNEIKKLVKELLEAGSIKESKSSFSTPVVLVKKKDGSSRMCVDYRELNKITIKDKFPIPMIDELLDELNETVFFTRLDLRLGYQQIRIKAGGTHKTAFQTHEGHYEFLVMPFGLTNSPATFQGLMNKIFKPYLRKFVLVFFDDILIYSKSWDDHIGHVK